MTELNVESKINAYIGKNPGLKKLPKSQVVSIMLKHGIITKNDAQTWYASMENAANSQKHNSAEINVQPKEAVKRSSDNVLFGGKQPASYDISKPFFQRAENTEIENSTLGWEKFANPKPIYAKSEKTAVEFLTQMTSDASQNISAQEAKDGFISEWIVNLYKETVNSTNAKSNVKKAIEDTKQDISQLTLAASGALDSQDWHGNVNKVTFEDTFKKLRGVEFDETNIQNCQKKAAEMANVQAMKDMTDKLKQTLDSSTVNSAQNAGYADANAAIINTFKMLGMGSTGKINAALKDIEEKCKDNPEINKYGGDFRISKNKAGKYTIYRTAKNGLPAEATMEELQVIAKEMKGRINTAFGSAIGAEIPENASSEQLEKITQDTYQLHKSEYEQVFEKAYGKKDLKEMSEKYMQSQQEGTAYVEMAVNMASMAAMFVGSGVLVQGAKLGLKAAAGVDKVAKVTNFASKAEKALKTAEAVTAGSSKVMPYVMATQIAQPVKLVENLTADESDWGTYFSSVAESGMWMALGMATGAVGDKARLFLGQKGLAKVAKDSGKSISELVDIYKSGGELPANLTKALKLIDNTAKVGGTSLEFTADVLMTYGIQKGLRGEDVTTMDYLMSANGAIMGTMMHNSFAKLAEKDKIKAIQNSLLETNPKISKAELENASKELLELHRVSESKKHETSKPSNESPEVTVVKEKSGDVSSSENTVQNSSVLNKDKFTLPDIPDATYLSESNADIANIKLSTKDKIKEFISPSENPFGALGEKQLQYVFDNNAKPHVQEQFGKAFDSIIAHAEESGVLTEKSDNVDFYKQYVLPDGTILFRNAIKDSPGNAKMRNCPTEVITVITPDGSNSFLVANSAENISKANKLLDLMSRIDIAEKKSVETTPLITKSANNGFALTEAGEKQVISISNNQVKSNPIEAGQATPVANEKLGLKPSIPDAKLVDEIIKGFNITESDLKELEVLSIDKNDVVNILSVYKKLLPKDIAAISHKDLMDELKYMHNEYSENPDGIKLINLENIERIRKALDHEEPQVLCGILVQIAQKPKLLEHYDELKQYYDFSSKKLTIEDLSNYSYYPDEVFAKLTPENIKKFASLSKVTNNNFSLWAVQYVKNPEILTDDFIKEFGVEYKKFSDLNFTYSFNHSDPCDAINEMKFVNKICKEKDLSFADVKEPVIFKSISQILKSDDVDNYVSYVKALTPEAKNSDLMCLSNFIEANIPPSLSLAKMYNSMALAPKDEKNLNYSFLDDLTKLGVTDFEGVSKMIDAFSEAKQFPYTSNFENNFRVVNGDYDGAARFIRLLNENGAANELEEFLTYAKIPDFDFNKATDAIQSLKSKGLIGVFTNESRSTNLSNFLQNRDCLSDYSRAISHVEKIFDMVDKGEIESLEKLATTIPGTRELDLFVNQILRNNKKNIDNAVFYKHHTNKIEELKTYDSNIDNYASQKFKNQIATLKLSKEMSDVNENILKTLISTGSPEFLSKKILTYSPEQSERFENITTDLTKSGKYLSTRVGLMDKIVKHENYQIIIERNIHNNVEDDSFLDALANISDENWAEMKKHSLIDDANNFKPYNVLLFKDVNKQGWTNIDNRKLFGNESNLEKIRALAPLNDAQWKNVEDFDLIKLSHHVSDVVNLSQLSKAELDIIKNRNIFKLTQTFDSLHKLMQLTDTEWNRIGKYKIFDGNRSTDKVVEYAKCDDFQFDNFDTAKKNAFAKKNLLKSGLEDLTDKEIENFFKNNYDDVFRTINILGLPTFEAAFPLKMDGLEDLCEDVAKLKSVLSPSDYEKLIKKTNPANSQDYRNQLSVLNSELSDLKKQFPQAKSEGPEVLDNLKKRINNKTSEIKQLQQQINYYNLEPNDKISKIRAIAALGKNAGPFIDLIKMNTASTKQLETAQRVNYIKKGFENRENKNQDFKTWFEHNVVKPHNDKRWNTAVNKKVFEILGMQYDENLSNRLGLTKNKYLSEILSGNYNFHTNFKNLLTIIRDNPDKEISEILNNLPQNIETKKQYEALGIDYDKWVNVDKNSFKQVSVELSAAQSRQAAIENLEADFNDVAFKALPETESNKLLDALKEEGFTLKENTETLYDDNGFTAGTREYLRLFKDDNRLNFNDLSDAISIIKKHFNSNDFWTKTDDDTSINDAKNTIYNHLMKLRDTEIKNAANIKNDTVSDLEIHKTDMNDLSHALFLGNHGHCCTAVGTGCNQFTAPTYIKNKCISAIEVMDGNDFVGNTMCYFANVDGKTSLILDNIELSAKYQNNDKIRDAFFDYTKQLTEEVGQPEMPIYAGPFRHKLNMNIYQQAEHELQVIGSSGTDEVYMDFTGKYIVDGERTDKVNLFKIR